MLQSLQYWNVAHSLVRILFLLQFIKRSLLFSLALNVPPRRCPSLLLVIKLCFWENLKSLQTLNWLLWPKTVFDYYRGPLINLARPQGNEKPWILSNILTIIWSAQLQQFPVSDRKIGTGAFLHFWWSVFSAIFWVTFSQLSILIVTQSNSTRI